MGGFLLGKRIRARRDQRLSFIDLPLTIPFPYKIRESEKQVEGSGGVVGEGKESQFSNRTDDDEDNRQVRHVDSRTAVLTICLR